MIWSRARIGFFAAVLLASIGSIVAGVPPPLEPIASVQLKDGRVLHNVKVMSDEGTDVVVRADEGLLKIAKANLPPGVAEVAPKPAPPAGPPQLVMQRFDPNQPPEVAPPEPGTKPKPNLPGKPAPAPSAGPAAVYKGCTIISFQMKAFQSVQGCAEVVIRNDTDTPVLLRPGEVSCTTADGTRHMARNIITDAFPPAVKRRDIVPARGQIDDIFAFANEPLDISGVQWTR